ncbi:MAG: TonB-dependent receptor [Saprospiraceae bacterium]|nr:TonB-dependent receptor [Saprospiraceae bacterium]
MKKVLFLFFMLLSFTGSMIAQRTISGKVSSEDGEPLIGATVQAKNTTVGTVTDLDGSYTISVPDGTTTLVVSYTGYATSEVAIGASNILDVILQASVSQLSEVIVVGYGTQIKSTLSGNIAKVSGEEIQSLPVPTVEQAIQGRTAGVFVEAVNGKPGGAVRVRVRGSSSITAGNQPLFIIDGIPVTTASQNLSGASLNPLADLNFNDVESIEILKDASAGAIYGSRAANGVILITTKKGKEGKAIIEADFQTGFSEPTNLRDFLNAEEYVTLYRQAGVGRGRRNFRVNPGGFTSEQQAIDQAVAAVETTLNRLAGHTDWRTGETDTDWQDLVFRTAQSSQATLSARGGTDKTKFFASAHWSNQEGILINNGLERLSGRLNLDQKVGEKVNFGLNMSLSRTFTDQVSNDNAFSTPMQIVALSPITPVRDENGVLYDTPTTTYYNGLIDLEEANRDVTSFRTIANTYVRYEIIKGLMLNGELGVDIYNLKDNSFFGRRSLGGQGVDGSASSLYSQVQNYTSKAFLNYGTTLGTSHNVDVTVGTEFQQSTNEFTRVDGQGFPVDDLKTIASAAEITLGTSELDKFSFLSYFARVNYNFDRKYLLTLSARADGSSRFGKNNRFGYFPAASAGWVLSEEGFLQDNKTLSFLKLRASYGLTGNAEIGNFSALGLYGSEGYNGQSGLQPTQIPNPDLEWEKTAQLDIGLDFGLFNDRLNGEIDYYIKNTTDLLLDVPVPGTSGFATQLQNLGEVENKGIEIVLNSNNLVGDFKWNTSLNFARNKNTVKALAPGQDIIDIGGDQMNVVKVGQPLGIFFGAEYAGVDPANGDALWYKNEEGGGRETTNDYNQANFVIVGDPNPDFIAGLTNSFSYKGISLDVMFQGVYGNDIHLSGDGFMASNARFFDNQTSDQLRAWQQPGDITDIPEARRGSNNGNQVRSSRYLDDGSYLRLKTLSLSYELPKKLVSSIGLSRLRVYMIGQNLLTFTDYRGWDPEVSADYAVDNIEFGLDFYSVPQPKTITFGLNVGF